MNTPVDLVCQAISSLPAESRDSFYIEQRPEQQRFFCKLCQVESVIGAMPYHFVDVNHQAKVALLKADLEKAKDIMTRYNRISSKNSEEAREIESNDVRGRVLVDAVLFNYLVCPTGIEGEALEVSLHMVRWFEQLDRLMLLGLAVWKSECLLQLPKGSDFYNAKEWMESGWKDCKQERISSNAIPIIVRAVGPFLGSPTLQRIFEVRKLVESSIVNCNHF